MTDFSELTGVELASVTGLEVGSELVTFTATDGRAWVMRHEQDCCETVDVNEIHGDVSDLIGSPILRAEEVESEQNGGDNPGGAESWTWTFYKLATIKGEVVIRWLGESNGYYSESVYFSAVTQ